MTFVFLSLLFLPAICAVPVYFIEKHKKETHALLTVSLICLLLSFLLWNQELNCAVNLGLNYTLSFEADNFRALYAIIASLMWSVTSLFSPSYFAREEKLGRYKMFSLFTFSSCLGVFFAADLTTAFFFFEMLSFASFPLVMQEETDMALKAGRTYLFTSVLGGMLILLGIMKLSPVFGNLKFKYMAEKAQTMDKYALLFPSALIMLGFGAKAGLFPLSSWLPKAHPASPAPASALLSGLLTKVGVFGIMFITFSLFLGFLPYAHMLLALSLITMTVGALLALFSVNIKRTLACSSMSQIGFILFGVAVQALLNNESAIAFTGAVIHMINHSLIKLLLFLIAGWLYMLTGSLKFDDLKGSGRGRLALQICFLTGALSISGVPGFSGYISKTLLHESILEYIRLMQGQNTFWLSFAEKTFVVCGGLTFAYMIKLYVCLFIDKADNKIYAKPASSVKSSLALSALFLLPLGIFPYATLNPIAQKALKFLSADAVMPGVSYFSLENLAGAGKSLIVGALVYLLCVRPFLMDRKTRRYIDKTPRYLQIENIVKPVFEQAKRFSLAVFEKSHEFAEKL